MAMFSDERLKEDIDQVGEMIRRHQPVYRYRYIGDQRHAHWRHGAGSRTDAPDAVTEIGGYKAVDYGRATQYAAELSKFLEAA
jgi:hypothetical protein